MHRYSDSFFDYIEEGSTRSAMHVVPLIKAIANPKSVLDVGCGRGAWLAVWEQHGCPDVTGVDGDYVNRDTLAIDSEKFLARDLARDFDLGRRFDLVTSLEVAEHLPPQSSGHFIRTLTQHADIVAFSAAVVNQGGENHVNERPLEFWRNQFKQHGFDCFDAVRPRLVNSPQVEPWYRNNILVYANTSGQDRLVDWARNMQVPMGSPVTEGGSFGWRVRRLIVGWMPRTMVTGIATANSKRIARKARPRGVNRSI